MSAAYSPHAKFLRKWLTMGGGDGEFRWPLCLVIDGAGNVYVSECSNDRIQVFDPQGRIKGLFNAQFIGIIGFPRSKCMRIDRVFAYHHRTASIEVSITANPTSGLSSVNGEMSVIRSDITENERKGNELAAGRKEWLSKQGLAHPDSPPCAARDTRRAPHICSQVLRPRSGPPARTQRSCAGWAGRGSTPRRSESGGAARSKRRPPFHLGRHPPLTAVRSSSILDL